MNFLYKLFTMLTLFSLTSFVSATIGFVGGAICHAWAVEDKTKKSADNNTSS